MLQFPHAHLGLQITQKLETPNRPGMAMVPHTKNQLRRLRRTKKRNNQKILPENQKESGPRKTRNVRKLFQP